MGTAGNKSKPQLLSFRRLGFSKRVVVVFVVLINLDEAIVTKMKSLEAQETVKKLAKEDFWQFMRTKKIINSIKIMSFVKKQARWMPVRPLTQGSLLGLMQPK